MGLTVTDAGVDKPAFLAEALELAVTFDQVNMANLGMGELIARRFQHWEERYGERLQSASQGGGHAAAGLADERRHFLGQSRGRGSSLVSPELEAYVAEKMKEDAAIFKERRKGREERALLAESSASSSPQPKPPKGPPAKPGGPKP